MAAAAHEVERLRAAVSKPLMSWNGFAAQFNPPCPHFQSIVDPFAFRDRTLAVNSFVFARTTLNRSAPDRAIMPRPCVSRPHTTESDS